MRGYYFITDGALSLGGIEHDAAEAVRAGVGCLQYRSKDASTRTMLEQAGRLKAICSGTGTRLIINDRLDIALAVGADGVHLGQDDMPYAVARGMLGPGRIIGITVHTLAEAVAAERLGADYLGVSPIFATATKADAGRPCGLAGLRSIRRECRIPLVAIGGIDLSSVRAVVDAGADMISAISAVVTRPDVAATIGKFHKEFEP